MLNRITTANDKMEEFGVLELLLPFNSTAVTNPYATMNIDRSIEGLVVEDTVRFLFSPKKAARFDYTISSNIALLNGQKGSITAYSTPQENSNNPSANYPNWWTDDPLAELKEDEHIGAKTVNMWRVDYLSDFAKRMERCKYPATAIKPTEENSIPDQISLSQNYPNPFNPQTTIHFSLSHPAETKLSILDIN